MCGNLSQISIMLDVHELALLLACQWSQILVNCWNIIS